MLYGATPIEDIINYNVIVRCLTEWTGTGQTGVMDQYSIADGVGGAVHGCGASCFTDSVPGPATLAPYLPVSGLVNTRQSYIQGLDSSLNVTIETTRNTSAPCSGFGAVPNSSWYVPGYVPSGGTINAPNLVTTTPSAPSSTNGYCTRRYQINFALGLFSQDKLIPTKFMASQLAIELTLEQADACIFALPSGASGTPPSYAVGNINLIPEILEFDASYGKSFFYYFNEPILK